MALPGYAAETSLYSTSRSYRGTHWRSAEDTVPTVITQHDPCAMPGDSGGSRPTPPYPPGGPCGQGRTCCGLEVPMGGRWQCTRGPCVPNGHPCPQPPP
jgi:hypothetical protein